jgi:hypothetical protein
MKRFFCLVVVLTVSATSLPAIAQEHDQSIFQVRSRDVGNAPPELVALCLDKADEVPIDGQVVGPPIPLNAEFWSLQTRASDGLVKNEFVRQVGTAAGCAYTVALVDEGGEPTGEVTLALYGDSEVSGLAFEGWGECDLAIPGLPTPASQTGVCNMVLEPDPEQGIAGGIMTSNSVLGEATGSFWTIRIIWE